MPFVHRLKSTGGSFLSLSTAALLLLGNAAMAQESCALPATWFSDTIPDPQQTASTTEFNTFCAFHTWAWNAFLWSMEEDGDALRFEAFPTQEQTINESFDANAEAGMLRLAPRAAKADHPIDSVAQAGTLGILVAQNNRAVYYSQYVSPQMYDQIIADNWNTAEGLKTESPEALFQVGNIEYKAAWAIVDDSFSVPGAYTRSASIPELVTVEVDGVPAITVPSDPSYVTVEVALIGFHVVGWVEGHSEAIWASFSPIGIAPVVPTDEDGAPTIQPGDPVSATSTPFYAAGTPLSECNQTQVPVQTLDDATQEFGLVTQVCHIYETGTVAGAQQGNATAINEINASAASTIPDGNVAKGYFEVGAVWSNSDFGAFCASLPSDQQPEACSADPQPTVLQDPSQISAKLNTTFQDALVGSNVLSNPVIETFTQTDVGQHNCFSCHNSQQFQPTDASVPPLHASMLNLSHFLMQIYVETYTPAN